MWSDLMKLIVARDEVNSVLEGLENVEEMLYATNESVQSYQQTIESSDNPALVEEVIRMVNVGAGDREEKSKKIADLRESLRNMRVMTLKVAVRPSTKMVEEIGNWVKERMGVDVILEWEVEKSLLGGTVLAFGGRYADLSVRRKLDEWWESEEAVLRTKLGL